MILGFVNVMKAPFSGDSLHDEIHASNSQRPLRVITKELTRSLKEARRRSAWPGSQQGVQDALAAEVEHLSTELRAALGHERRLEASRISKFVPHQEHKKNPSQEGAGYSMSIEGGGLGHELRRSGRNDFSKRQRIIMGILQVCGELLITGGVLAGLFVGWLLWGTNFDADRIQGQASNDFVKSLPRPSEVDPQEVPKDPIVDKDRKSNGEVFGVVYIPRFGSDYSRPLVEGTGPDVLDTLGLGHYPTTAMPGETGNFAIAGHRQTHGAVLDNIDKLVPGDKIYVQTKTGYYTYIYRNSEIVLPTETMVLTPVPMKPQQVASQAVMTMTSCNPRFGSTERIIAYSLLESWRPISSGPPAEISAQVKKLEGD